MQCLGSRRAWEHSQRGHILSEKLSTGSQHDQMKKHLCFSPLQFARDVLRQIQILCVLRFLRMLQFARDVLRQSRYSSPCRGKPGLQFARDVLRQSPGRKLSKYPGGVAICAGCAEAKIPALVAMAWYLVAICAGCAEAKTSTATATGTGKTLQFARDVLRQSQSLSVKKPSAYPDRTGSTVCQTLLCKALCQ